MRRDKTASDHHGRSVLLKAGLAVLSVLFALLGLEVAFRLAGFPFAEDWTPSEFPMARFDPEVGWVYTPDRTVFQQYGKQKRELAFHFDDIGARVGDPEVNRDPDAPTVVFVGGSFTMGHGLAFEESFVGVLEASPEFGFQVVNLGVQAFGTDQALLMLERHAHRFNVKAVVYTFISDHVERNDNYDRRMLYRHIRILGTKPLFALGSDGMPDLQLKPRRVEDLSYSRVWALLQMAWIAARPSPPLDLTRALVREMQRYVESVGATFVVVHWRQSQRNERPGALEGMGLNLIDTGKGAPDDWAEWLLVDRHPDARAHRHVAELLIEEFRRLGLIPEPRL